MTTQAERREATTRSLVESARRLFATVGFANASIDKIAAEAGVTRGALYHHFDNKEALFETVFRSEQGHVQDALLEAAGHLHDPHERLSVGVRAFIECVSQPERSQILLIDGPSVLGTALCREIDEEVFLDIVVDAVIRLYPTESPSVTVMLGSALIAACCNLAIRFVETPVEPEEISRVLAHLISGPAEVVK